MISEISIRGFKCVLHETVELGRLNILIGANGSGKSAILEAIGALGASVEGRVDDAALLRRGVRPGVPTLYKSAFLGKPLPRYITLSARTDSDSVGSYEVSLDNPIGESGSPWRLANESLASDGISLVSRSPRGATFRGMKGQSRTFKPPDATRGVAIIPSPFGPPPPAAADLLERLRDFAIFDPQTPVLRGTEADMLQRDPIGLHGGRLAEAVQALQRNRLFGELPMDNLFELLDWTKEIRVGAPTPELLSPSIPAASEVVQFVDRFMKPERNILSGYDASEGALYVLFALVLLFHPRAPRFLAIENVDHALHPRLARALLSVLSDHIVTTKRQFVLTSHNPLVLDALVLRN